MPFQLRFVWTKRKNSSYICRYKRKFCYFENQTQGASVC